VPWEFFDIWTVLLIGLEKRGPRKSFHSQEYESLEKHNEVSFTMFRRGEILESHRTSEVIRGNGKIPDPNGTDVYRRDRTSVKRMVGIGFS